MEESTRKKSSSGSDANRRPAFTIVDWIIAAFSVVLLVYLLVNMPAY